jgi:HTH-type transcriptional regulator, transcriptional repressor of NAD biosynthesis genes
MTTRGFLLGKFMPPHAGHVFLAETASGLCDQLTVLVCSLDREPIDGRLRHDWMTALLPRARVLHYAQDVPQEPAEHPDFWAIWRKICRAAHPEPIDYVFGSEPYVVRLAQELGARAMLIDPERLAFPVSGTAIREHPAAHWDMIPGPVRPHFQRRIVLAGAESTGKSTLARDLATHLGTRYVPEYGRVYDAGREDGWTPRSFEEIEAGHQAMRRAIQPAAGPLLIEDTDELVTRVWEHALTGAWPTRPRPAHLADLYLLLETDLPWVDDGVRYHRSGPARQAFQTAIRRELLEAGVTWHQVTGTGPERLHNAITAIEAWRGGRADPFAR